MRGVPVRGDLIRRSRESRGLTQELLAAAVGCDVKTVRKAEAGASRVDLWVVSAIADALGCTVDSLIPTEGNSQSKVDLHLSIVKQWHEAFQQADLERLLSLHTEDSVLEIPGSDDLPAAGNHQGIDQLREHFAAVFKLFRLQGVQDDDFRIHAVDDLVFLRSTATLEYLPLGKSYTTRHVNEFEFRDGKISRRMVVADYDGLRQILAGG